MQVEMVVKLNMNRNYFLLVLFVGFGLVEIVSYFSMSKMNFNTENGNGNGNVIRSHLMIVVYRYWLDGHQFDQCTVQLYLCSNSVDSLINFPTKQMMHGLT